jgi:hypothetical protein
VRAENRELELAECIDDPRGQGRLRADDREIYPVFLREGSQSRNVVGREGKALSQACDACIAWRAVNFRDQGAPRDLPDKGMFTGASTDDKDLHGWLIPGR